MILVAGVGYQYLGDLSFGPVLIDQLRERPVPDGVEVEDLSFGPIAVMQWFQDDPARFSRAILVGAVRRGRLPATLTIEDWKSPELDVETIQERVNEAVTGVINLENTLLICDHFGVLPARTTVIDLEPVALNWGAALSEFGQVRMNEALSWIDGELELSTAMSTAESHRVEDRDR